MSPDYALDYLFKQLLNHLESDPRVDHCKKLLNKINQKLKSMGQAKFWEQGKVGENKMWTFADQFGNQCRPKEPHEPDAAKAAATYANRWLEHLQSAKNTPMDAKTLRLEAICGLAQVENAEGATCRDIDEWISELELDVTVGKTTSRNMTDLVVAGWVKVRKQKHGSANLYVPTSAGESYLQTLNLED